MSRWWAILLMAVALCRVGSAGAQAADTYSFVIRHPTLGDIGTYTDRIERSGDRWQIETTLHIAVRVLGVVVHREDAQRFQTWQSGRLMTFHGITTTNGERVEIRGEAEADGFRVVTPSGSMLAPGDVVPSDPWQAARGAGGPTAATMLSTKSGRVEPVIATGGERERLAVHGVELAVRHFVFSSDKRQDVWVDPRGIPVVFRTVEDGTPIDFVLSGEGLAARAALR